MKYIILVIIWLYWHFIYLSALVLHNLIDYLAIILLIIFLICLYICLDNEINI